MMNEQVTRGVLAALVLALSVSLTACAGSVKNALPAAPASKQMAASPAQPPEYQIRAGDQLDIKFFYNDDLNEQVTVRPDGRISLQLAHEVMAAGLTPAQLTDLLTKKYASELDKPEIAVIVRSFGGQRVFVDGEVNKPGILNLIAPMTVVQSLAEAGGVKDTAKTNKIIVIRRGADARPIVMVMDMDKVVEGMEMGRDLYLMPNDIVYVPRSNIANVNLWVDQYIRKNIPLPIGLYYNMNPH